MSFEELVVASALDTPFSHLGVVVDVGVGKFSAFYEENLDSQ